MTFGYKHWTKHNPSVRGFFFLRGGRWLGFYSWETEAQRSVNFSTKQNQLHRSKLKRHWSLKSTGKTPYSCSPDTGWPWSLCGCVDDWLLQLWRTARLNVKENLWEACASVSLFVRWLSFSLQRIAFFSIDTYFLSKQHTPNNQTKKKKRKRSEIKFFSFLQVPDCCHFPRNKAVGEFEEIRAPHRGKSH